MDRVPDELSKAILDYNEAATAYNRLHGGRRLSVAQAAQSRLEGYRWQYSAVIRWIGEERHPFDWKVAILESWSAARVPA